MKDKPVVVIKLFRVYAPDDPWEPWRAELWSADDQPLAHSLDDELLMPGHGTTAEEAVTNALCLYFGS